MTIDIFLNGTNRYKDIRATPLRDVDVAFSTKMLGLRPYAKKKGRSPDIFVENERY